MEYKFLGKTGIKVSRLCLGTMTFGRETDRDESFKILNKFKDSGGNFIDTANVYSDGMSEEIIGEWLKNQKREELIIATKVRFKMKEDVNAVGLSKKHIIDSAIESLKRLKTDYIDLYQIHAWDNMTEIEETLDAFDYLVKSGKVRYIGACNLKAWQLQKAIDIAKYYHLPKFCCLQSMYNLLERGIELEIVDVISNENIGFIPWSPLRGGWLSGKFYRGMKNPPEDTRVKIAKEKGWSESWDAYNNENTWKIIDELLNISKKINKHPAQIAINWLLQKPFVTSPIIGARNIDQLMINLHSVEWEMEPELLKTLDEVSDLRFSYYPYSENYKKKYHRE